jgi:hypothetical protein
VVRTSQHFRTQVETTTSVSPFHELKKRQNHKALDKTMHQTDRYDLRLNKTVGMFLVCLTLWNTVLGASGGLSMCLHVAGELHLTLTPGGYAAEKQIPISSVALGEARDSPD